jgi:hypothetical protein
LPAAAFLKLIEANGIRSSLCLSLMMPLITFVWAVVVVEVSKNNTKSTDLFNLFFMDPSLDQKYNNTDAGQLLIFF